MIALSLLVFATTFAGGTVDEFANSLSGATEQNAIVVTGHPMTVPKFSYDASSPDALAASVKKGSTLVMAPGADVLFSDRCYVGTEFQVLGPNLPGPPKTTKTFPSDALKDGKVTLTTKSGSPLSMQALVETKWAKPLTVDYLLKDLAVSASVKDMPERTFLTNVAKAAGAYLSVTDAGYKMTYDSEQLRARVVNTLKQADPTSGEKGPQDLKREFYESVVNVLPGDGLVLVFEQPDTMNKVDIVPNSDLANVCVEYIQALEAAQQNQAAEQPTATTGPVYRRPGRFGNTAIPPDILSRVDTRSVVHLRFNGHGAISLAVPIIQGRSARYIDL